MFLNLTMSRHADRKKTSFKANVNLNLHELESHGDPGKASEMITGLVPILLGHDLDRTRCQTTGLPETPSLNSNRIQTWRPIDSVPRIPAWCQGLGPIWLSQAHSLPRAPGKVTYSEMMRFWQGTVFLMQVPLRGSTLSTMTNGASSSVTMLRWSSSCSSVSGHIRGHT